MRFNRLPLFLAGLTVAGLLMFAGCKDNSTDPTADSTADEDAAETVAAALGDDNGGAMDQVGDVTELATSTGISASASPNSLLKSAGSQLFTKSYNATTQKWSGNLVRYKGNFNASAYAYIRRAYEWQFLNKSGVPQQNYITGTDTAATINFAVIWGKTYAFTPRLKHVVDSLTAVWTVTNANTPTITINGSVYRTATDTVGRPTLNNPTSLRTLSNKLVLTFTNVTASRGNRSTVSSTASGAVTGTYDATVSFTKGTSYSDKTIHRDINVTFTGGTAAIGMGGGKNFSGKLSEGTLK